MSDELRSVLGIDPGRLVVLPNPVDISGIRASIAQDDTTRQLPGPVLLTVGRLAPEKGLDLLLQAFARIKGKFPSAALRLAGTGPCESALKAQCSVLGISDCVQFVGQVASPAHLSGGYAAFVLASRHEGLPNALLEAAAAGLPIVATPASRGLADLLRDRPGVWLASDVSAEGLEQALLEALTTLGPGERFHHAWIDAFDRRVAIRAYEDEIDRSLLEIRT